MYRRSAIRTTLDKHLSANCAELAAYRIGRFAFRPEKETTVNFVSAI